ncbi:ATP-binding cassette domain-containing protein [Vagococcus carniphilus]|uniref:ATP-binding cassette domain-containing protein n=1 Tax=Vagococcus carniphilus TaxID=218144 RepID=UPI003B599B5A
MKKVIHMMKLTHISLIEEKTGRSLISNLDLVINQNSKLAVIGEEGNGKSSLLHVIRNRQDLIPYLQVEGKIDSTYQTIGYLNQSLDAEKSDLIVADLFEEVTWDNLLIEAMEAFQIDNLFSTQRYADLSGGEKLKYQLLAILATNPEILLLDEPTNNLDLNGIEWLETFIKQLSIPVIFVSHDEAFIQATANELLHLELTKKNQVPLYTLSKDEFYTYKEKREKAITSHNLQVKNEQRALKKQETKLQDVWNKAEHQHTQVSRADPRLQKDNVQDIRTIEEQPTFFFSPVSSPKKKQLILDLDLPVLENEKGVLAKDIHLPIFTQDKLIITGENGVGKSTLIRKINETLQQQSKYKIGFMPQNYEEVIDLSKSVLEVLNTGESNEEQRIRTLLANLNFTRDEMLHAVSELSGGQQAKILLVKLMLEENEVLILDEPTRNLSPLTNQFFYDALSEYQGTIIAISHDRKFISSLDEKQLYELTAEGINLKK